jgi:hypothetical protein
MVYDWYGIISKSWYYAQLYRLEHSYEVFLGEEKILLVHSATEYDEYIQQKIES